LAVAQGVDFIEPDLVMTQDGHLVARHDSYLSTTTDVADHPEFIDRRREMDGRSDWFVEDFTLAELKRLRARQPFSGRSTAFDDRFEIPSLAEILVLLQRLETKYGRRIGLYPETKHPSHFAAIGLDMAVPLLGALAEAGLDKASDPVFIQSFEPEILRRIDEQSSLRLVLLLAPDEGNAHLPAYPNGLSLAKAADFVDGLGVAKSLVLGSDGQATELGAQVHAHSLALHAWTLRDDAPMEGFTLEAEYQALFTAGVDGVFTDFPDSGITQRWLAPLHPRAGQAGAKSKSRDDGRPR